MPSPLKKECNLTIPSPPIRYLAVDLHKHYLVLGGLDAQLNGVLAPKRLNLDAWPAWAQAHLRPSDHLVVESTSNAFDFYDQVAPYVGRGVVANPAKIALIALIASTRVKTDKADTLWLARLLVAGLIPEVWVPPAPVRELRSLLAHRQRLVQSRTRLRNRLHSVLHRHQLAAPEGDPFAPAQRSFWAQLAVSPTEQLRVRHDLAGLDTRPLGDPTRRAASRTGTAQYRRALGRATAVRLAVARLRPGAGPDPAGRHRRHHPFSQR